MTPRVLSALVLARDEQGLAVVRAALDESGGNVVRAARALGLSHRTLCRWLALPALAEARDAARLHSMTAVSRSKCA